MQRNQTRNRHVMYNSYMSSGQLMSGNSSRLGQNKKYVSDLYISKLGGLGRGKRCQAGEPGQKRGVVFTWQKKVYLRTVALSSRILS